MKLGDLPIGAIVQHSDTKYLGKPIQFEVVAKKHVGYPTNSVTLQTKQIITAKAMDAQEPKSSNSDRRSYGNNNTTVANLPQWLNSNQKNWYAAQHGADQAPDSKSVVSYNPYASEAGFLTNFPKQFVDAILPTTLTTVIPDTDGGGTTKETLKIFLPSRTEVGLGDERSGSPEGSKWERYTNDSSRQKTRTAECIAQDENSTTGGYYWLRTPYSSSAYFVRYVYSDGALGSNSARNGNFGVAPALNLSSDLSVSKAGDVYEVEFNQPPSINTSEPDDKGEQTKPFSVSYNVTDAEGDKTSVVEKLNNTIIREIPEIKFGEQQTITISESQWDALPTGSVSEISIEANAVNGNGSKKVIKFTKTNNLPTIKLDLQDDTKLNHGDKLVIKGTTNDKDKGDAITTYYNINKGARKVIASNVSDGTEKPYSKTLTMRTDGETASLLDGSNVIASGLAANKNHTVDVWSEDNNGGKSITLSRRFQVVPNRPPALTIDEMPKHSKLNGDRELSIKGSATDPDGDDVTIEMQVGLNGKFKKVDAPKGKFDAKFKLSELSEGSNIITIKATDTYGATDTKQVRVNKDSTSTSHENAPLVFDIQETPETIDTVKMWVKVSSDHDVKAYWSTKEEVDWKDMDVEEVTSPTGNPELQFSATLGIPSKNVSIKFHPYKGFNLVLGGMSNSVEGKEYKMKVVANNQIATMHALVDINKEIESLKNDTSTSS